ncbi:MAG: hypothetical protein JXA89_10270 [Anaerolineae bacterium]|nr:hypothetical protein [Anaerolineae bacterium]
MKLGRNHPSLFSRILLSLAIVVHLTMLVSWRTGTLNRLFFDATVTHGHRGWDFYALYQAGHNVLGGYSAYESDGAKIDMVIPGGTYTPFRYLPVSAYTLGVLLNLVSPLWAYRLWVVCIELCLLLCIALTWKQVTEPDRRLQLTAMWLCYTPFYLELYMGQFSFVQATLFFFMLISTDTTHTWRFDLAWIGSVLWKQNTALLSPVMLRLKKWRALILLALLLSITAVPYFALVPGALSAFWANFTSAPPWFQFGNLGFRQFVFDLMWSISDTFDLGIPNDASVYTWAQTLVVVTFISIPLAFTALDRNADVTVHLCLWMTTYFLIYHHVWEHHYVMLLPALTALLLKSPSKWLWAIYILLALPTPFYLIDPTGLVGAHDAMRWTPIRPLWQDLAYHASKAIPTLLLYGWLSWKIIRSILTEWASNRFYLWPIYTPAQENQ